MGGEGGRSEDSRDGGEGGGMSQVNGEAGGDEVGLSFRVMFSGRRTSWIQSRDIDAHGDHRRLPQLAGLQSLAMW